MKQPKTTTPTDADLRGNPGIGQSRGTKSPEDFEELEADSTVEGDVDNETTAEGGIDPGHMPHKNA